MDEPGNPPRQDLAALQITEEDLVSSAASVRALQISRLEQMWRAVHVHLVRDEDGEPIDPRLLEIGLRIVKEESTLYRLYRPPASSSLDEEELPPVADRRSLVSLRLDEIEAKLREKSAG